MTWLTWLKWGGMAAAIGAYSFLWFHLGGASSETNLANYKTDVEGQHVAQLQAVLDTMGQHDQQAAAQHAADRKVIDAYDLEKALPPATAGLVERMRIVEGASCGASGGQLPGNRPLAGGVDPARGVPGSDPEADRLLQAAFDAGTRDALRLNAVTKLAPKASH